MIVSQQSREVEVAAALERGADDYVTKPLALDELMARIRVGLRRAPRAGKVAASTLVVGELEIDVSQRRVLRAARLVHLTPTEYALLGEFARYADKLLTERMFARGCVGRSPREQPSDEGLYRPIAPEAGGRSSSADQSGHRAGSWVSPRYPDVEVDPLSGQPHPKGSPALRPKATCALPSLLTRFFSDCWSALTAF
jgi:hypothetical protein